MTGLITADAADSPTNFSSSEAKLCTLFCWDWAAEFGHAFCDPFSESCEEKRKVS